MEGNVHERATKPSNELEQDDILAFLTGGACLDFDEDTALPPELANILKEVAPDYVPGAGQVPAGNAPVEAST